MPPAHALIFQWLLRNELLRACNALTATADPLQTLSVRLPSRPRRLGHWTPDHWEVVTSFSRVLRASSVCGWRSPRGSLPAVSAAAIVGTAETGTVEASLRSRQPAQGTERGWVWVAGLPPRCVGRNQQAPRAPETRLPQLHSRILNLTPRGWGSGKTHTCLVTCTRFPKSWQPGSSS